MRPKQKVASAVVIGAVCGLLATVLMRPYLPGFPLLTGLTVGGQAVAEPAQMRQWLTERDRAYGQRPIMVEHAEGQDLVPRGELGFRIDVNDTVRRAFAAGHRGSWMKRLRETTLAREGKLDVPLAYRFDAKQARRRLAGFAKVVNRPPVDAKMLLAEKKKIADIPGRRFDLDATVAGLERQGFGVGRQPAKVSLVVESVSADLTLEDLRKVNLSTVLSSFETRYSPYKRGRSANVALATDLLDGLILRPSERMSFNDRVGPRSRERGFQFAPEIVGDELTVGVGGGTCQVSSTLYAAALYGGMKIVQRRSHSRPSSYMRLGLDATVAYPYVDLKIENPFPFIVVVHARIIKPGLLRVELLGGEAVSKVRYAYSVSRIKPFVRRIKVRRYLKPGRAFRKQKGTRGMDVHSFVTIEYLNGKVEKRQYFSGYRATPEVYWVAPGYDHGELPELPSWAKGVEGRVSQTDNDDYYPSAL